MNPLPRSPLLMSADDTGLLVVDVQDKLVSLIPGFARIVWNIGRLLDAAKLLGVPFAATEQYPKGLGKTIPVLAERLTNVPVPDKVAFSCGGCTSALDAITQGNRRKILVVGIETHVCIGQTVHDLLADGYQIYLAVDAIGARFAIDHETALRRMETAGATLTTTEAAIFEWCREAGSATFKELSALVRQGGPE